MQDPGLLELASIMTDTWEWLKKRYPIADKDEYWDEAIRTADAIWFKHNKHPLCRKLLMACMTYIEELTHEPTATQITGPPA